MLEMERLLMIECMQYLYVLLVWSKILMISIRMFPTL